MRRATSIALILLALAVAGGVTAAPVKIAPPLAPTEAAALQPAWSHAYAAYGAVPKYPRGFDHFDFANPSAPKGGTLKLNNPDRRSSFDKYNPYTVRGLAPAGLTTLMFETLGMRSGDEPGTMYGVLAEEMQVAPDLSSISFRLHPKAHFINGDPVAAADVKHSFEMLTSKEAAPLYRTQLGGVQAATVIDERTIRFELKDRSPDTVFNVGQLPVFSRKWGQGTDGKPKRFDEIVTDYPITSGPYRIGEVDLGRRIEFVRDASHWGRDLGVNRGFYNFDRVVYIYYQDNAVSFEAFKAGEFDLLVEYSARRWARQHAGPKWDDGRIVKEVFPNGFGAGLQSYLLNLRRPLFQDRRVREAINLTYDFDAINVYKQYRRTNSMFDNSQFAATGTPGPGELALLEPYRGELPPEVFGPAWRAPATATQADIRNNLRKAKKLLEDAGWKVGADGVLRNAKGEPLEFEYLKTGDQASRAEAIWQQNCRKLGINLKVRLTDYALFKRRLEKFDFDMVMIRISDFALPSAAELKAQYGSETADVEGADNYRGVKSKAVDHVLSAMEKAKTMDELRDAARALDRIVTYEHWQVPELNLMADRVSRWADRVGVPRPVPKHYTISYSGEWIVWAVTGWWSKEPPAQ